MTETSQVAPEQKVDDKTNNFRALEARYERQLQQERSARIDAERMAQEAIQKQNSKVDDEDDDSEPYVDKKKLNKTLSRFGEQNKRETQSEIQKAVQTAIQEERKSSWMKQNPDFYSVLEKAEMLAKEDPELAESLLEMPEGFERQKLVYKTIKSKGLHQPPRPQQSIQDKIDANRRTPFYQPTGVGTAPYSTSSDFSPTGQKEAYTRMQELKNRLRLG